MRKPLKRHHLWAFGGERLTQTLQPNQLWTYHSDRQVEAAGQMVQELQIGATSPVSIDERSPPGAYSSGSVVNSSG